MCRLACFISFGEFSTIISLTIFSVLLFPFLMLPSHAYWCAYWCPIFEALLGFFYFFLCSLACRSLLDLLSSSLLNLFSPINSNLMLNPSSEIFLVYYTCKLQNFHLFLFCDSSPFSFSLLKYGFLQFFEHICDGCFEELC